MRLVPLNPPLEEDIGNGAAVLVTDAGIGLDGLPRARVSVWNGKPLATDVIALDAASERKRLAKAAVAADPIAVPEPAVVEAALLLCAEALRAGIAPTGAQAGGSSTDTGTGSQSSPYQETPAGLAWLKPTPNGDVPTTLANFIAKIVGDVAKDNGAEEQRYFEVEARLRGRVRRFNVPAVKFAAMNWPTEYLGAGAIVSPGLGLRDHCRAAIQWLSGEVPERRVYTHVGWRHLPAGWVYLHAGGAIGAAGPVGGIEVELSGSLAGFDLPAPPNGQDLARAIRASLGLLEVAPKATTVPLLAAVYRAAMGQVDFSLHLAGQTGVGKSELAALAQQHYGAGLNARQLPASWLSTGNSLETLAFEAKDALIVVDDFAPTGSPLDVQRFHREADRLLRAQGNRSGRQRLSADATLKVAKPPRGLILSTGEDVPRGQSLRARLLALEVSAGDVDWGLLTACQREAAAGLYAQALAGFVRSLAGRYDGLRTTIRAEVEELRQAAARGGQHKRTPAIVAELASGLRYFLAYAREAGAITEGEVGELWDAGWEALGKAAAAQEHHQAAAEPARRFLELLNSAISSGRAYLAAPDGGHPGEPEAWGWRGVTIGSGEHEREEWQPRGACVGWIDGDDLYLEPDAAYSAAQAIGREVGDALALTPQSLRRRLKDQGVLASTDVRRETVTIRRTFARRPHDVLHLRAASLSTYMKPDKPDKTVASAYMSGIGGRMSGSAEGEPDKGESPRSPLRGPLAAKLGPFGAEKPYPEAGQGGNVGFVGFHIGRDGHPAKESEGQETMSGGSQNPTKNPTTDPTGNLTVGQIAANAVLEPPRFQPGDWVWQTDSEGVIQWPEPVQVCGEPVAYPDRDCGGAPTWWYPLAGTATRYPERLLQAAEVPDTAGEGM
ncbi:MAG: DUF927 domain-containing protein, partial [Chloroflexota bacterium]